MKVDLVHIFTQVEGTYLFKKLLFSISLLGLLYIFMNTIFLIFL